MAQKIDDSAVRPSAAPTEAELELWLALPVAEQKRRLEDAIQAGFESGASTRTIDDIIAAAKSKLKAGE